ncbi:hypothetical protein ZIOFF_067198 [Zingiber officinale]|uniref:Uncharacterized protein n=1 Tax=Zingiber officinale TaxID=94328 RepID=A0A8J5EDT9_ZINOF|nr:hypothetical protein ZIOFF_067198 [Zingiber officinale]
MNVDLIQELRHLSSWGCPHCFGALPMPQPEVPLTTRDASNAEGSSSNFICSRAPLSSELFDRHNGSTAAIYSEEYLLNNILNVIPTNLSRDEWVATRALVAEFVKTDKDFQTKGMILLLWHKQALLLFSVGFLGMMMLLNDFAVMAQASSPALLSWVSWNDDVTVRQCDCHGGHSSSILSGEVKEERTTFGFI